MQYTRREVRRMLSVTERQLKDWERNRLIQSGDTFGFSDLIALRTLIKLQQDRIPPRKIQAALSALRDRLQHVRDPLKELKVISDGKRIRVEVDGHHMEPISGQLLLNFTGEDLRRLLSFPKASKQEEVKGNRQSADLSFHQGLEHERRGAVPEAIRAYENAVKLDPHSAGAWLNLGTIFFNARQFGKAEGHYKRALEADPKYALAHFNIANLYDERGDQQAAVKHYQEAVRLQPVYADAHYNLALLFQGMGQVMEAVRHWKIYLKLDPGSDWGAIARRELEKLRKSTLVQGSRGTKKVSSGRLD